MSNWRDWETSQRFESADEWKGDLLDRMAKNPAIQDRKSFRGEWHRMLQLEAQERAESDAKRADAQPVDTPVVTPESTPEKIEPVPTPSEYAKSLAPEKYKRGKKR